MNFIKKSSENRNKNLVIVRAGRNSLHKHYFYNEQDLPRSWDRMVLAYEEISEVDLNNSEFVIHGGLTKWTDFYELLRLGFFKNYDYDHVLVTDDDVIPVDNNGMNLLFARAKEFNLKICQPSLTHDSYSSWKITLCSPAFHVRFTNFVECMCPLFNTLIFDKIEQELKNAVSGCGLDLIFSELLKDEVNSLGIIDDVKFKHTKPIDPVGGAFYEHLRRNGINPNHEVLEFLNRHNLKHKNISTHGGIPVTQYLCV
jgi:hypothetical protein